MQFCRWRKGGEKWAGMNLWQLGNLYFCLKSKPFQMQWKEHIHSDPKILVGKPVVKGTRLSVVFILGLFSNGWTEQQVLENYPQLTKESLRAVFAYVQECMEDEIVIAA